MLGEELVPGRHGVELLEGQRVDPAQDGQVALGLAQARGLLVAVVGNGLGLLVILGQRRAVGAGDDRHELIGAVLRDQLLWLEAEFAERPVLQLLDPHAVLDAHHLVTVGAAHDLVEALGGGLRRVACLGGAGFGLAARLVRRIALGGGLLAGGLHALGQ